MSIRLEEISEACRRRLHDDELCRLRAVVFKPEAPARITVDRATLFSLIGSYERSHYEPASTDYGRALRTLLAEALESLRCAQDMARQNEYLYDDGWLEAALTLLRQAQRRTT